MKKLNQAGVTLIELLATLVLVAIISVILFSLIGNAIENNRNIQQDNMLRDEADIMMSKVIKAIYATNQTAIIHNTTENEESHIVTTTPTSCSTTSDHTYKNSDTCKNYFLEISTNLLACAKDDAGKIINKTACNATLKPLGFSTNSGSTKLYILDEVLEPSVASIKILPSSKIIGNPGETSNYEVQLHLEITQKKGNKTYTKRLDFENEIQPIVQTKGVK